MPVTEGPYTYRRNTLHLAVILGGRDQDGNVPVFGYANGAEPESNAARACFGLNLADHLCAANSGAAAARDAHDLSGALAALTAAGVA